VVLSWLVALLVSSSEACKVHLSAYFPHLSGTGRLRKQAVAPSGNYYTFKQTLLR